MGHYCKICRRTRPNEKFSGRGHQAHVCKQCAQMPKEKRMGIGVQEEIFGFFEQSHISDKNIARLQTLVSSENQRIAELANIVLQVAQVTPYKRRRHKVLVKERKDLLQKLEETGFILDEDEDI